MEKVISDSRGMGHLVTTRPSTPSEEAKVKYIFKNGQCLPYAVALCKKHGYKEILVLQETEGQKIIHAYALKNNQTAVDIEGNHKLKDLYVDNFGKNTPNNEVEGFIKVSVDEAVDNYAKQLVNLDWNFAQIFVS